MLINLKESINLCNFLIKNKKEKKNYLSIHNNNTSYMLLFVKNEKQICFVFLKRLKKRKIRKKHKKIRIFMKIV